MEQESPKPLRQKAPESEIAELSDIESAFIYIACDSVGRVVSGLDEQQLAAVL